MSAANQYLLRHPFSLQKITWNPTTQTVIYRSKSHHTTKRNFEIFKAPDFIAAIMDHLPPKGHQAVRYYGLYSNNTRGQQSLIPDRIIRLPKPEPPPGKNQCLHRPMRDHDPGKGDQCDQCGRPTFP